MFTDGIGMTYWEFAIAYWPYVPVNPFGIAKATFLLTIVHPIIPPPFSTTIPDPYSPGIDGLGFSDEYAPLRKARSDGLIGAAITLTRTSPSLGFGIGTSWSLIEKSFSKTRAFIVFPDYFSMLKC